MKKLVMLLSFALILGVVSVSAQDKKPAAKPAATTTAPAAKKEVKKEVKKAKTVKKDAKATTVAPVKK